jgi:hypothetical protein
MQYSTSTSSQKGIFVSDFQQFQFAVYQQFEDMKQHPLFVVDASADELWEKYLSSYPEGTNPIFRKRGTYDCSCCRQFVKKIGPVVTLSGSSITTVWDNIPDNMPEHFKPVAQALSSLVKSRKVVDVFYHVERKVGQQVSYEYPLEINSSVQEWNHFYCEIPAAHCKHGPDIAAAQGNARTNKEVLQSSLETITPEACNIVLELIDQNSLYRGQEQKFTVQLCKSLLSRYHATCISGSIAVENFLWTESLHLKDHSKIKNKAVGTLLVDLSKGVDLEDAVRMFEAKMDARNYQRPKALATKTMIEGAQKTLESLGLTDSLFRRYATADDITINNVLYASREIRREKNVFDTLKDSVADKVPDFSKLEEVPVNQFIGQVLPSAKSLEVWFDRDLTSNLVSLIAPQCKEAPAIFKWDNNFSWSYTGEVADSIKERVKKAGGDVEGVLRASLSWHNYDDLDLHLYTPAGHIYFGDKKCGGGFLDVDMNAGAGRTREPVENIIFKRFQDVTPGTYLLQVNQYWKRESKDVGFELELFLNGVSFFFSYAQPVTGFVTVAEFTFSPANGFKITSSLAGKTRAVAGKEIWGIQTQKFHPVQMVMNSPNHWDGNSSGNRHLFFILKDCKNPEGTRGFYNEQLKDQFKEHRKVFELLSAKTLVEPSADQLSGLGFSSTVRGNLIVKVSGSFNRTIKVML